MSTALLFRLSPGAAAARERMRQTLRFMESLGAWNYEMLRLASATLEEVLRLGAAVQGLVRPAKAAVERSARPGRRKD